jgi:hypothetical protein
MNRYLKFIRNTIWARPNNSQATQLGERKGSVITGNAGLLGCLAGAECKNFLVEGEAHISPAGTGQSFYG